RWTGCLCPLLFQGRDCIRGFHVTGVQTCALPISKVTPQRVGGFFLGRRMMRIAPVGRCRCSGRRQLKAIASTRTANVTTTHTRRSEERRVGEAFASEWCPERRKSTAGADGKSQGK